MVMMMIFIIPPCSIKNTEARQFTGTLLVLYICCNSGEDLEVFAPSDNSTQIYKMEFKISRNYFFFQRSSRYFSFLEEVKLRGRHKTGEGEKSEKGKGRESPFPSLPNPLSLFLPSPPLSKPAAQVRSGCLV